MKKSLFPLLMAASLMATGCAEASASARNSKSKLQNNGYEVSLFESDAEVKAHAVGFNYEGFTVNNGVFATKGSDDNADFFLGLYFADIATASNFIERNNNENFILLNQYANQKVGSNLKAKVGVYNNVCYACSETSYAVAF